MCFLTFAIPSGRENRKQLLDWLIWSNLISSACRYSSRNQTEIDKDSTSHAWMGKEKKKKATMCKKIVQWPTSLNFSVITTTSVRPARLEDSTAFRDPYSSSTLGCAIFVSTSAFFFWFRDRTYQLVRSVITRFISCAIFDQRSSGTSFVVTISE